MTCERCGAPLDEEAPCPVCGAENRPLAALAYLPMLWLLPLLTAPKSRFARFHANQGMLMSAVWAACLLAGVLLNRIRVTQTIYPFGMPYQVQAKPVFAVALTVLLGLCAAALAALGAVSAARGRRLALPVIGKLRILK